jgi:glutamate racemase
VDTLVLGCTHYPLLKKTIASIAGPRVRLIDSAEETAREVEEQLKKNRLLNPSTKQGRNTFYVTDNTASFMRLGERFLRNGAVPAKRLRLENI